MCYEDLLLCCCFLISRARISFHDNLENSHNAFLVSGSYPIAVVLHWAGTKLSFPPIFSEITASRKQLDLLSSIFLYAVSIF